jgi:arylsulfatase A-like enzyme
LFLLIIVSLLTVVLGFAAPGAPAPNFVVILADDLGHNDVGFNGATTIRTPHIDALAASGARFLQFYVQPLCSPTRAALLTGRYPMRQGLQVGVVRPWAQYGLPLDERTLPQALKDAGYGTFIVGKWHLGAHDPAYIPTRRGFDHHYGHYMGAIDYFTHQRDGGFDWHRDGRTNRDEGYSTDLITQESVRIIREQPEGEPLFLYVAFNAVHAPHQVPAHYKQPYAALPEPRRTYAGMVAAMDEGIGKILAALEQRHLRTNTLIIFSSDNGGPRPGQVTDNGFLRAGKGTLYEGGVCAAACAAWPGQIPSGTLIDEPIHIVDLYPTLLKLAQASLKQRLPIDGLDIWPVLSKRKRSPHDEILLNAEPQRGAIRKGDWKLVLNGHRRINEDGLLESSDENPSEDERQTGTARRRGVELFNLAKDPQEKMNLAAKRPEKVRVLRWAYERLSAQAVPPKASPPPKGFKVPSVWGEFDEAGSK